MSAGAATPVVPAVPATAATGVQGQAVAIVDASRVAIAAARAVLLEAIVQGRGGDGVVTLKTPQGNVQIRATTPLPTGSTVALELTRTGEQLSARLLPVTTLRPSPGGTPAAPSPSAVATTIGSPAGAAGASAGTPAVRASVIGSATFGAIALASDPSQPSRMSATPTTTPATPAPAPTGAPGPLTSPAVARAAPMPLPVAQPAAAASGARGAGPSGTPATATLPVRDAPLAARVPWSPAQAAPTLPARTAAATNAGMRTGDGPGIATQGDMPSTARAAAVAVYAQARATAPPRAGTSPSAPAAAPTTLPLAAAATSSVRATADGMPAANHPPPGASPSPQRLQPGTALEVRLASATPQAPSPGVRAAQPLAATVVGAMPQGRLVVDTALGRLAVNVPPDLLGLSPGKTLALEWLPETLRAPLSSESAANSSQSTRTWPQARDAAATLLARPEPALREAAEQLVPKPGPRLAHQMMGFIGRGDGDIARWLGEAVMRQLEQSGLAELLGRSEGGAAREPDRQPGNGDWRHVTMPLFDGAMLRPIEIRTRRRNGGEAEGGRDQSRFVVDCVHDELGAVQIDGLMTSATAKKRLDVILRSHVEIPEADRAALAALFSDTCGAMGLGGEIAFQVLEHFPVVADNPLAHRAVIA
jgi:hypothetical protein